MSERLDLKVKPAVRVWQGESITQDNGKSAKGVVCDDIANLALAIHKYRHFFSLRRQLNTRYSGDFNGSGDQLIEITSKNDTSYTRPLILVVFSVHGAGQPLYEADLIKDHGKDYNPTINWGKKWFGAKLAEIRIDWDSAEILQWRCDIERLSRSPDSLTAWIDAELEMLVRCSSYMCGQNAILTKRELTQYLAAGLSLEDLKTRLTCSKCGKREAKEGLNKCCISPI